MSHDSVSFVILWPALILVRSSSLSLSLLLLPRLLLLLLLLFLFGSDVAKPLYGGGEKPVAGLYWADYHAPSVGAIRDARAAIQGPVTCPAGEWRGAAG